MEVSGGRDSAHDNFSPMCWSAPCPKPTTVAMRLGGNRYHRMLTEPGWTSPRTFEHQDQVMQETVRCSAALLQIIVRPICLCWSLAEGSFFGLGWSSARLIAVVDMKTVEETWPSIDWEAVLPGAGALSALPSWSRPRGRSRMYLGNDESFAKRTLLTTVGPQQHGCIGYHSITPFGLNNNLQMLLPGSRTVRSCERTDCASAGSVGAYVPPGAT